MITRRNPTNDGMETVKHLFHAVTFNTHFSPLFPLFMFLFLARHNTQQICGTLLASIFVKTLWLEQFLNPNDPMIEQRIEKGTQVNILLLESTAIISQGGSEHFVTRMSDEYGSRHDFGFMEISILISNQ